MLDGFRQLLAGWRLSYEVAGLEHTNAGGDQTIAIREQERADPCGPHDHRQTDERRPGERHHRDAKSRDDADLRCCFLIVGNRLVDRVEGRLNGFFDRVII